MAGSAGSVGSWGASRVGRGAPSSSGSAVVSSLSGLMSWVVLGRK